VNAIVAVYSVVDSLGADDFLRPPLETLANALEGRINVAGLSAEAERVAAQMRGETTAATAAQPKVDWYHEKHRMLEEWRESTAFQDARESFRGVPIAKAAICFLADASVDVSKAAQMTDDELLKIHGMGPVTLGKLRQFFAEREQYEEEAA
jgi:hypothetical protein